jgi:hypothetical protein
MSPKGPCVKGLITSLWHYLGAVESFKRWAFLEENQISGSVPLKGCCDPGLLLTPFLLPDCHEISRKPPLLCALPMIYSVLLQPKGNEWNPETMDRTKINLSPLKVDCLRHFVTLTES